MFCILIHLLFDTNFNPAMRLSLFVALLLLWSANAALNNEHEEFMERARIRLQQINDNKNGSESLTELAALKKQISGYAKAQQQKVAKAVAEFKLAHANHLQVISRWAELKDIHTNGGSEPILCHEEHQAALRDPLTKGSEFFDCASRVFKCKNQHPELLGEHFEQYKACLGATVLSRRRRR
jgi:hypothetical protein